MKLEAMVDEIRLAIKNKNLKNLSKPIKRNLIIIGAILLLFVLFIIFSGGNKVEASEEISNGYKNSATENVDANGKDKELEYIPPKIEDVQNGTAKGPQNSSVIENESNPKEVAQTNPPAIKNPFVIDDTSNTNDIPDMSNTAMEQQRAAIEEIAKRQKPSDMIAFLKEAQHKFDFLKTQRQFKFDLKSYEVGDIFLWWEIEEITPIYIRFKDSENGYAYN